MTFDKERKIFTHPQNSWKEFLREKRKVVITLFKTMNRRPKRQSTRSTRKVLQEGILEYQTIVSVNTVDIKEKIMERFRELSQSEDMGVITTESRTRCVLGGSGEGRVQGRGKFGSL